MTSAPIEREDSDPFAPRGWQAPAFSVSVYDKDFVHVGWLGGYESLIAVARHNDVSTAQVVLRKDHPRVAALMKSGARLVIRYDGATLMSGRIEGRDGATLPTPTIAFRLLSDFQFLSDVLGWVNPSGAMTEQGTVRKHYVATGPAESVLKEYVQVNSVDRLNQPVSIAPDLGRGRTITVKARMESLADRLVSKVDLAGLGIRVVQYGSGLRVDVYEPTVRTRVLSVESGVLVDSTWSKEDPVVTRVVLAGGGEGTRREFRRYVDTAREADLGWSKEALVEVRDLGDDYENAIEDLAEKTKDLHDANIHEETYAGFLANYVAIKVAAQATLDLAPATGAAHDTALAAFNTAEDNRHDAAVKHNTYVAELAAAQTAYDAALALRDDLRAAFPIEMADAAADALAEGGTKYGLSVTLAETAAFRYGKTLLVGDTITVDDYTDVCREVTISDTADAGIVVSPTVGDPDQADENTRSYRRVVRAVRKLLRDLRHQKADR